MSKQFASAGDMAEKTVSFTEIGANLYAFTAEGDPNTGVIVGDDSVMVIDAQATPAMASKVIEHIRQVTDKPVRHVVPMLSINTETDTVITNATENKLRDCVPT